MRERARLLRGVDGRAVDGQWLTALEAGMAARGVAVAAARRDVAAQLSAALVRGIGIFPAAEIFLEGDVEGWLDTMAAVDAEARLAENLAASRRRDGETGGAAWGPHRSDIVVRHRGKGVTAAACSTGEQKALLISLVLADTRLRTARGGAAPLLLLDEVAAHLDRERRAALFDEICALGAQAWLTGTDRDVFAPLGERAQFFSIADAQIEEAR